MKTLLLQRQGSVLRCVGGQFRVELSGEVIGLYPADLVEEVIVCGGVSVTTPALRDLMTRNASLHVLTLGGRHVGAAGAGLRGNVALLRAQVRATDDPHRCLSLAHDILHGKLRNARATLQRYRRTQSTPAHDRAIARHDQAIASLAAGTDAAALLGLEGGAASAYFEALRLTLPGVWAATFLGRERRPPPDPVNALLSFGYALLFTHVLSDCLRTGLHPAMGVYHLPHGARPTLALDLMEEHRAPLVDRLVVQLLSRRVLTPAMFEAYTQMPDFSSARLPPASPSRGVRLTAEGRSLFLRAFADRLQVPVKSARGAGSASYRELISQQVRAFAAALRTGDAYRSAFMK